MLIVKQFFYNHNYPKMHFFYLSGNTEHYQNYMNFGCRIKSGMT